MGTPLLSGPEVIRLLTKTKVKQRCLTGPKGMNGTEQRYADHLRTLKLVGEILAWEFQAMTLRGGPDCRLTVDFLVIGADGSIFLDDTKGTRKDKVTGRAKYLAQEDSAVKIRLMSARFPYFRFRIVWEDAGNWVTKEIE